MPRRKNDSPFPGSNTLLVLAMLEDADKYGYQITEKGHKKRRSVFDNCRGHKSPRCVISAARRYSVVRVRLPAAIRARSRGAYHVARVYYFYFKLPPFQKVVCRQA